MSVINNMSISELINNAVSATLLDKTDNSRSNITLQNAVVAFKTLHFPITKEGTIVDYFITWFIQY